ncbi:MAG: tetratricopeptide repeat protein [Bacteroidales bacterium]
MNANIKIAFLFFVFFFYCGLKNSLAEESVSELKEKLSQANHDTTRIQLLFNLGNLYIDGPSDSLIYYYQQALQIIESTNRKIEKSKSVFTKNEIQIFQELHCRANIEIGIENFFQGKYDSSLRYYETALTLAETIGDLGLISEVYGAIGIVYKNQGMYAIALEYYEKALAGAIELKDTSWMAACYTNTGNVYRRIANYPKALNYFLKAQKVFEKEGEKRRMAIGYMNIGNLYEDQKDLNTALEYYSKALQLSYESDDKKRISECLMNIGNTYLADNIFEVAREYFRQAIQINEENEFMHIQDDCYKYIGQSFEREENFDEAIVNYNTSMQIAEKEGDKITLAEILGSLSNIYLNLENFEKSLDAAEKSLEISLETGDPNNIKNAYLYLTNASEKLKNPVKALYYHRLYSNFNDSIFNIEKYKSIKDIEMKYESEKKQQQLALLEEKNQVHVLTLSRRNRLYFATLIGIGLLLMMTYMLLRNRQLKAKHRAIELEQKLMRSQMNPHFIFNSLIAIQSYIYKSDAVQAGDFLARFADLIRITLENSRVEYVLLEKELKMLKAYLELQALRFDDKFDFKIEVEPDIDPALIKIPPMMAQPFIENAIVHGLRHKDGKGLVKIRFKKDKTGLVCMVEDNGIGREKAGEFQKKKDHQSMATSITRERLAIFSKRMNQKFGMTIHDAENSSFGDTGTIVVFNLPTQNVDE